MGELTPENFMSFVVEAGSGSQGDLRILFDRKSRNIQLENKNTIYLFFNFNVHHFYFPVNGYEYLKLSQVK